MTTTPIQDGEATRPPARQDHLRVLRPTAHDSTHVVPTPAAEADVVVTDRALVEVSDSGAGHCAVPSAATITTPAMTDCDRCTHRREGSACPGPPSPLAHLASSRADGGAHELGERGHRRLSLG